MFLVPWGHQEKKPEHILINMEFFSFFCQFMKLYLLHLEYPIQFFFSGTLWTCQTSWHLTEGKREHELERCCKIQERRRRRTNLSPREAKEEEGVKWPGGQHFHTLVVSVQGVKKYPSPHIPNSIYFCYFATLCFPFSPGCPETLFGKENEWEKGVSEGSTTIPLFPPPPHILWKTDRKNKVYYFPV